jgi:hypothetical protein
MSDPGIDADEPSLHALGRLPPWQMDELPAPPAFTLRNALRVIGPGAILLAGSIGGGEWLVGPSTAAKYGPGVFWIATLGILLQLCFNLEAIRYTLYTGEPIATGFLRLRPGSRFWAGVYSLLAVAQLGVPALAGLCASVLFAGLAGRLAVDADQPAVLALTYGMIVIVVLILMFGGTIERMLEWASWFMIAFIFVFLLAVNVLYVPPATWQSTAAGFFQFGYLPEKADFMLLATLAATAGSGGIGNMAISNWVRDKGFGMGSRVGAIASAVGGRHVTLSHTGKVFPITAENLRRWAAWWRYVLADQVWLWALGCFVGMFLNVNLARAVMPAGKDITGIAAGAYQAKYLADHIWPGMWALGLLNGFWILFSTHLGNTDTLVRTVTDITWTASSRVRQWRGGVAKLYYALLIGFSLWGAAAVWMNTPMEWFKVLGTMAGLIMALASVQVLVVNTRLLPPELRPGWLRRAGLVACALFYGAFSAAVVVEQFR